MFTLIALSCAPEPDSAIDEPLVEQDTDTDSDADSDTDSDSDADSDTDSDSDTDPPSLADIDDHSVNRASVALSTDDASGDVALWMTTESGSNDAGAFHGGGVGNKAIAGVPGFDGLPLAELAVLRVQARPVLGDPELYLNVLVDLGCDGEALKIVVVAPDSWGESGVDADGYLSLAGDPAAGQWRAVGGLDDILPSHLDAPSGTLTDVLDSYPDACLRDADTLDGGMPVDTVTRSVLWLLGDSANTDEAGWYIRSLSVGDVVFEE